jgi:hypothetical protein
MLASLQTTGVGGDSYEKIKSSALDAPCPYSFLINQVVDKFHFISLQMSSWIQLLFICIPMEHLCLI